MASAVNGRVSMESEPQLAGSQIFILAFPQFKIQLSAIHNLGITKVFSKKYTTSWDIFSNNFQIYVEHR